MLQTTFWWCFLGTERETNKNRGKHNIWDALNAVKQEQLAKTPESLGWALSCPWTWSLTQHLYTLYLIYPTASVERGHWFIAYASKKCSTLIQRSFWLWINDLVVFLPYFEMVGINLQALVLPIPLCKRRFLFFQGFSFMKAHTHPAAPQALLWPAS